MFMPFPQGVSALRDLGTHISCFFCPASRRTVALLLAPNNPVASSVASTYNDNNEKTITQLISEIRSRLGWIGVDFLDDDVADADEGTNEEGGDWGTVERKVVRLLDYACGPGMVSRALAPYVSQIRGIDLSPAMASVYNTNASNQGLLPSEMSASVGNILDPADPSPADFKGEEWFNFDLAVVGLGFHHFENPVLAATRLAERLKPGGVLMITDFLPHELFPAASKENNSGKEASSEKGHSHSHGHHGCGHRHRHGGHGHGHEHGHNGDGNCSNHGPANAAETVAHAGFAEEDIRKIFESAGVGKDFGFEVIAKGVVFALQEMKVTRHVFVAKGMKV